MNRVRLRSIFFLPVVFLLPASIMFLVMDEKLAQSSGGRDTPDFTDVTMRWGMSGGLNIFILFMIIGSIAWLIAFSIWMNCIIRERKPHWKKAGALLLGFLSHPWVFFRIWDFVFGVS